MANKNLFARVPAATHDGLVQYCAKETVATGRRVSMNAVVARALSKFLARARPSQEITQS
jgi:hypothetical protein